MTISSTLQIEVVYALEKKQVLLPVCVPDGATVEEAIHHSGVLTQFPEIDLASNKVGIFSKLVKLEETVRDRDRVEIYRPLIADPKEVRRQRAEAARLMKREGVKSRA